MNMTKIMIFDQTSKINEMHIAKSIRDDTLRILYGKIILSSVCLDQLNYKAHFKLYPAVQTIVKSCFHVPSRHAYLFSPTKGAKRIAPKAENGWNSKSLLKL